MSNSAAGGFLTVNREITADQIERMCNCKRRTAEKIANMPQHIIDVVSYQDGTVYGYVVCPITELFSKRQFVIPADKVQLR